MRLLNAERIVYDILRLVDAQDQATFAELGRRVPRFRMRAGNCKIAAPVRLLRAVRQGDPVGGRERERNHRHVRTRLESGAHPAGVRLASRLPTMRRYPGASARWNRSVDRRRMGPGHSAAGSVSRPDGGRRAAIDGVVARGARPRPLLGDPPALAF